MKVCIHRGTQQIGGTCIEIEAEGKRLVLDLGLARDALASGKLLPSCGGNQPILGTKTGNRLK